MDAATRARIEWLTGLPDGGRAHAALRRCPDCRAQVLTGPDSDFAAITVRLDPTPLSPLGEALALTLGRGAWRIAANAGRLLIDRRSPWAVAGDPAGTLLRADVLTAHTCGNPWPSGFADTAGLSAPTRLPVPRARSDPGGPPPF
jgi:hypothetical protein